MRFWPFRPSKAASTLGERERIVEALERTMHPDPEYRERRLAQFTRERRERYWRNVGGEL